MVVANEFNFAEAMREEGVSAETIKNLRRKFKGWRIYFRGKVSEYEDIKSDYEEMLQAGYTRTQALEALADSYEKTIQRIKEIVAKQGDLFEV